MALIKFYKTGEKWVLGNYDGYPAGTCVRYIDETSGVIYIRPANAPGNSDKSIVKGFPTEFCNASGTAYADLAAFKAATDDFFVKSAGITSGVQITNALGYTPAPLDSGGKVPAANLPSYVDDAIEGYLNSGSFYYDSAHTQIITPETGKIYVDITFSNNYCYRWTGSAYANINMRDIASQSEAETGTDNTKAMTPLRTFQSWYYNALNYAFSALPTSAKTLLDSITELFTNKVDDLGGTIYHSTPWFTPVAGQSIAISADGLTVTLSSGALFTSAMVGARIVINGVRRVVGSYTSTSVMGVSSAFPASMRGITYTYDKWKIHNKYLYIDGNQVYEYTYNGGQSRWMFTDGRVFYSSDLGNAGDTYRFVNDKIQLGSSMSISFGNNSSSNSTRDLALKRNTVGILEINDGNTAGVYRDLNLRNLNYTGSLTNTSDIRLKKNIRPVTDGLKKVIDISKTIRHYEFIDHDAYGSGVITSEIAQYLLDLGFDGHVKQRLPRNEDEGRLFGWEYAQKEIVDKEGNSVLDNEGNKTFETVVVKEGDLIYTVDSQALTIYLFPAIVELNDKITAIEERLNKAGL